MKKTDILNSIINSVNKGNSKYFTSNENDYISNGLKVCGVCNEKKETYIVSDGERIKVRVMCDCERNLYLEHENKRKEKERKQYIEDFKNENIKSFKNMRFDKASYTLDKFKMYCEKFDNMKKNNIGLMIYGGTGIGKTYIAGCIANELIEKGYKVFMSNILDILEYVQDNFDKSGKKEWFMNKLKDFDLIIIDDFGMETTSDFELKNISKVINTRYEYGLPILITTNIDREEMQDSSNLKIQQRRIYSRIAEMTYPIKINNDDIRLKKSKTKEKYIEKMLNG